MMLMKKCTILLVLYLQVCRPTPVQQSSSLDNLKDIMLMNEEVDSINEPLLNLHFDNPDFTSVCWAESIIITENKHTKNQTISKAYSILLDSPGNLQNVPENEETSSSCYEVMEKTADPKKTLNFTTVKETEEYIIKEHKTLFCGAGPVLSHHFIVWPKLKRKQIEISINPLGASNLKNCSEIMDEDRLQRTHESINSFEEDLYGIMSDEEVFTKTPSEETTSTIPTTPKIGAMHGPKNTKKKFDQQTNKPVIAKREKEDAVQSRGSNKIQNFLLTRNVNCSMDKLGVCKEMIAKSRKIVGPAANGSKIVMGKWFFPDAVLAAPLDKERSFKLNVRMIVNLKKNDVSGNENNESELVVEEECLYVIPKATSPNN